MQNDEKSGWCQPSEENLGVEFCLHRGDCKVKGVVAQGGNLALAAGVFHHFSSSTVSFPKEVESYGFPWIQS